MSKKLTVRLLGKEVGVLELQDGRMRFTYSEQYVKGGSLAISNHMPLQKEHYAHRDCLVVFGGMLPEGQARTALAQTLGVSEGNDYRLLEEVGGDCAGAIELVPYKTKPRGELSDNRVLSDEELDDILRAIPQNPLVVNKEINSLIRMSLAGAQPKLSVIKRRNKIYLPGEFQEPTNFILKPETLRFKGVVENEAFCMSLARKVGFNAAAVELFNTVSGLPYLAVKRYDRSIKSSRIIRVHQEDMCQALGYLSNEKYQNDGGPTVRELTEFVRSRCKTPAKDLLALWDTLVFNFIIGNCDAHGKNFSILYTTKTPDLAPLYDLVSTAMFPNLTTRLAMSIGGAKFLDEVNNTAWVECAKECKLSPNLAEKRKNELTQKVLSVLEGCQNSELIMAVKKRSHKLL